MPLGPRVPTPAQEDALVMGGDVCQGQGGPLVPEAEPVLVLPRCALTTALVHAEDEGLLLLVDLSRGGRRGGVLGYRRGAASTAPALPGSQHSQKTIPHG